MIPDDDPARSLTVANSDDPTTTFVSLVGNTYAMLITGEQTNGQYCLIDMRVPDGGGPPPHRHDFEEMFTILEGEIEFTFRGEKHAVRAGSTVNIPANAPHFFRSCRTTSLPINAAAPSNWPRSIAASSSDSTGACVDAMNHRVRATCSVSP